MNTQEILVYIILAVTAFFVIRYIYRQVSGKNNGCNCGSCPHSCPHTGKAECHCHDTSTTPKSV